jgi:hypothetical protein
MNLFLWKEIFCHLLVQHFVDFLILKGSFCAIFCTVYLPSEKFKYATKPGI